MKVYKEITGYQQSIIDFNIIIESTDNPFSISLGIGSEQYGNLDLTRFSLSGYEGYIFDNSGSFIGGYKSNTPFQFKIVQHKDQHFSSYINNKLINNDIQGDLINCVEFDKNGESSISFSHKGLDTVNFLKDSNGIILISSDNIVLTY